MKKSILVVAAHPDDEILGCAGTVAKLVKEGCEASTIILGEGVTSRDLQRIPLKRKSKLEMLKQQCKRANALLGIKKLFIKDFPDNRFDTVPFLDIVKVIEEIKNEIKPAVIFTHFGGDLNIDHQTTFKAVITAVRPLHDETVREIYAFETLSSTEWGRPNPFDPNVFFDIQSTIDVKLNAMKKYVSELRSFPHPRSLKGIALNASQWGMKIGAMYAEAFEAVRIIR